VALRGNAADVFTELADRNFRPDIVTEMCPCHDPYEVVPAGMAPGQAREFAAASPEEYLGRSRDTMLRILRAMNRLHAAGAVAFEYGTLIRKECMDAGMPADEALALPGCIAAYVREMFLLGRGPFRWTCASGALEDRARLDRLALDLFPGDPVVQRCRPRRCSGPIRTSASGPT
jgi:urocanate hydratase